MSTEQTIWDYLLERIGNSYGVAGLMGNLHAESRLIPTNLQDAYERSLGMTDAEYTARVDAGTYDGFVTDAAGYGLAQWTAKSRKAGLMNLAWKKKKSIGDLGVQLDYLWQELQGGYRGVLDALVNAKSVREASDIVLTKYEVPRDQGEAMKRKRAEYGEKYFAEYAKIGTTAIKKTGREIMTAAELIGLLTDAARNYATVYMYAAYGFRVNDRTIAQKSRQNLNGWYTPENIARLKALANRTPPVWGFDCVNLLKGILWGWRGDETQEYGGAKYASNGVPDTNADGMIGRCYDVTDDFTTLLPGEGLWVKGHWGTYIGNGLAVECTTAWTRNVQVTAVHNLGKIAGYNGRRWTKHGRLPWIDYTGAAAGTPAQAAPATPAAPANPMTAPLFPYTRLLKRGARGTAVRGLQDALNRLGFPCGAVDGVFGAKTEAAVRAFQRAAGIEADGQFGPISYAEMAKRWEAAKNA